MLVLYIRGRQKSTHKLVEVLSLLLSQFIGHALIEDADVGCAVVGEVRFQVWRRKKGVEELAAPQHWLRQQPLQKLFVTLTISRKGQVGILARR